jgi:hypothetical protein
LRRVLEVDFIALGCRQRSENAIGHRHVAGVKDFEGTSVPDQRTEENKLVKGSMYQLRGRHLIYT